MQFSNTSWVGKISYPSVFTFVDNQCNKTVSVGKTPAKLQCHSHYSSSVLLIQQCTVNCSKLLYPSERLFSQPINVIPYCVPVLKWWVIPSEKGVYNLYFKKKCILGIVYKSSKQKYCFFKELEAKKVYP